MIDSLLCTFPFRLKYWCNLKSYWRRVFAQVDRKKRKNLKQNSSRTFYLLKISFNAGKVRSKIGNWKPVLIPATS